jgi:hypothetical protein
MSEENSDRYIEALRQIKLLETKVAKLDHQLQNAALLDSQKQEQIEDLKSQLELHQKSVINLAQSMKHPTGDSFIEKLTLKLYNLVISRYDRLSELEVTSLTSTLVSSPFLSLIIAGIILQDPSRPFSSKDILEFTNGDINDIIEWIDWFVSTRILVEFEDGRFQARQYVIDKVFSYKDPTKVLLDQLFGDFRAKLALSIDQRQYELLLRQLLDELNRRHLQIASKELEKMLAELGLGFKKAEWIFEQLNLLYKTSKENLKILETTEGSLEPKITDNEEEEPVTTISPKNIRFTPKSFPPKPIYERFTVEAGLKSSTEQDFTVTTIKSVENEQKPVYEAETDINLEKDLEKEEVSTQRRIFEIFLTSRKEIVRLKTVEEVKRTLISLRNNLENILSGRVIFELSQLIAELRKTEEINIDEITAKIDKWSSY